MAAPNSVTVKGLDKLLKNLDKYSDQIIKEVDAELTDGAQQIEKLAKTYAPVDEGKLRGSISAKDVGPFEKEVVADTFYAAYMEFGTGKKVVVPSGLETYAAQFRGKANRGNFEDMVRNIYEWMRRNGMLKKGAGIAQARFLAAKILKNGIKPQPFFFRSLDAEEPKIINNIKNVLKYKG